ncbi:hypothetical protein N0V88_006519 [Collariella sp. IMI 366227]|nr:hypothetical protein N0V88_006519 [Collariella sp. IMI 366227]
MIDNPWSPPLVSIENLGWDASERNFKKTLNFIMQHFERGTSDSDVCILQEFVNSHRESYDKMDTFQTRITYLRKRLNNTKFKMSDKAYIWLVLQGIANAHSNLYHRSVGSIATLTWESLMAELRQIALVENARSGS